MNATKSTTRIVQKLHWRNKEYRLVINFSIYSEYASGTAQIKQANLCAIISVWYWTWWDLFLHEQHALDWISGFLINWGHCDNGYKYSSLRQLLHPFAIFKVLMQRISLQFTKLWSQHDESKQNIWSKCFQRGSHNSLFQQQQEQQQNQEYDSTSVRVFQCELLRVADCFFRCVENRTGSQVGRRMRVGPLEWETENGIC